MQFHSNTNSDKPLMKSGLCLLKAKYQCIATGQSGFSQICIHANLLNLSQRLVTVVNQLLTELDNQQDWQLPRWPYQRTNAQLVLVISVKPLNQANKQSVLLSNTQTVTDVNRPTNVAVEKFKKSLHSHSFFTQAFFFFIVHSLFHSGFSLLLHSLITVALLQLHCGGAQWQVFAESVNLGVCVQRPMRASLCV